MADRMITFNVRRFDGERAFNQEYSIPYEKNTLLGCLTKIREEQDASLCFTSACRHAICGSCAVQVNGNAFRVIGVYNARVEPDSSNAYQMDNFIVYPYTASRILGGDNSNQEYLVKAKDNETLSEAITEIGTYMRGQVDQMTGGINVYSESQWQQDSNEYLNMISLVLGGIAAISLVVGGIGIMNIMLVTVTERTREIGIRRAIGATRASIVSQFLIEAAMLCGLGGIVGILVGTVCSVVLSQRIVQMTIYPALWVTLAAFGLSVLLGVLFGSYPAAKASKLQPVEALRAE